MLPISRHRTLVIPHRLALVAAAICLALSFTADRGKVEERLRAERAQPLEQVEPVSAEAGALRQREQSGDGPSGSSGNVSLLPWFSGLMRE